MAKDNDKPDELDSLTLRMHAGDKEAAAEFLRKYSNGFRMAARKLIEQAKLGRHFDSIDIVQSVFRGLWVRVQDEDFNIEKDEDLVRFVIACVANKVKDKQRHFRAEVAHRASRPVELMFLATGEPGPDERAALREVLRKVRHVLTEDEWRLVQARAAGRSWVELAAERGEDADSLRKRLLRVLEAARDFLARMPPPV